MFGLLPVDMINGILLNNNVQLPISIGQVYKIFLLLLLFIRFLFTPKLLVSSLIVSFGLLLPTIYQMAAPGAESFLYEDSIKITKYLTPFFSFLFFVTYIKTSDGKCFPLLKSLVTFSFWFLAANVLLKYIGLGYPAYDHGNIGSKGYFFAGNELSGLLIILSSILAFDIWQKGRKKTYYLFLALNLLVGLTIASKTAILGIILIFFAIPYSRKSFKLHKLFLLAVSSLVFLPVVLLLSWSFIQNTALIVRLQFFYEKFDFWTFILSNRNVFLEQACQVYATEYNLLEKIIGVGNSRYELLNDLKVVEMDIVDIFFAHGFLGLAIFLLMISFVLVQANRFTASRRYPFSGFVTLLFFVLLLISTLAGHVFGSGMAAVFLGLLFSLMYLKKPNYPGGLFNTPFSLR